MLFSLYWLNGKREVLEGDNIADAFNCAGYGQGALRALDVWHPGDEVRYDWDGKEWISKALLEEFSCPA